MLHGYPLCGSMILAALAALGSTAHAESASDTSLIERIEKLEETNQEQSEELDKLREATAPDVDAEEAGIGTDRSNYYPSRGWLEGMAYGLREINVDVHGFADLDFIDAGPDGSRDGVATFDNHHANLFVSAQLRPNLRAHTEFEWEHGGEEVEVDQAFVAWGVFDWVTFTAGRFYAPFGIERFANYSPVNQLISRPLAFREIIPGNFYQQGLMLSGNVDAVEDLHLTYEVSGSNGLGDEAITDRRDSRQNRDNNSGFATTGRVAAIYWPWVEVGTSIHWQEFNTSSPDQELLFWGADVSGRWQGFEIRAEYVLAELDKVSGGDLDQDGWYVQGSYTFDFERELFPQLTLVARVDQVDLDDGVSGNNDMTRTSIGYNLMIYEHFRHKLEYQFASEKGPTLDNNAILAQFVIDF